ncbi:MAG: hypothetical protein ACI86H_000967 [bacterium]|jgi:hypothetical protein
MTALSNQQSLTFPLSCPSCKQLVFLHHDGELLYTLDSIRPPYQEHICSHVAGEKFFQLESVQELLNISWGSLSIPTPKIKAQESRGRKKYFSGIITKISKDNDQQLLEIMTDESTLIKVSSFPETSNLSAGMLVNLTFLVSTQDRKFRLKQIKPIYLKDGNIQKNTDIEYYKILISGPEQEKLEKYIQQFLALLQRKEWGIFSITPLKNEDNRYFRELKLPSSTNIKAISEELPSPFTFKLSIQQVTDTIRA